MPAARLALSAVIVFFSLIISAPRSLVAADSGEYIAIRKQGSGRIALVLDRAQTDGRQEAGWAESINSVVHDGLDFTGFFTLIPPPLNVRQNPAGKGQSVNFAALNSIGAEIYAGGKVAATGANITFTAEVYEALGAKPILRKSYTGTPGEIRSIAHQFCADLVELLTGKKSLFGSKIVFVSNKSGFKEIYQCDFDGAGLEQLTSSKSITLTPVLSPDGRHLAYTDFSSGRPALYIRDLSTKKTLTAAKSGVSIDPGWRNNSEVATTLSHDGDQNIYLLNTAGAVLRRLTNSKSIDLSPTFSPDGGKMAFVSSRNGMPQIFIQNMQSGEAKRLTFSGRYNTQPSWSPAGDKIAYTTWENKGEIDIFVVNADGSALKQLTAKSGENEAPSWSPDGEMIVFSSTRHGRKKLYVMNASGENQRPLLHIDGDQMQPSWSLFTK